MLGKSVNSSVAYGDFGQVNSFTNTIGDRTDTISYTYDAEGLRTSKTVKGTKTEYYWLDGVLQGQKTGNEHIIFLYDENGTAYGMLINDNGTENYYYYLFNLQGDVVGIMDSTGNTVVEYTYDAWGQLLSTTGTLKDTLGQKNPLRYRGYYYDAETGFYYLQSRYYDPYVQRFINADGYVSTGTGLTGYNMFVYCGNDPINRLDFQGNSWTSFWNDVGKKIKTAYNNFVTTMKNAKIYADNHFKNSDGSYSLYSNDRSGEKFFNETISRVNVDGGLDIDGELGLSLEADFVTGGWHWEHFNLQLLDFFHAEAALYKSNSGVGVGAFASIYSPSISFDICNIEFEIGLEIGSIGAMYGKDGKKHTLQGGYFWGGTISWEKLE